MSVIFKEYHTLQRLTAYTKLASWMIQWRIGSLLLFTLSITIRGVDVQGFFEVP